MNDGNDYRRVFWIGVAVMLILIGISVLLSVLYNSKISTINYMMGYMGWLDGFAGLFMGLIWLFFIIWLISWFFRWLPHSHSYYHRDFWDHDEAVEILRERYAKGEITKDQFDQMLADLERGRKL